MGKTLGVEDPEVVLGDRHHEAVGIDFLEGLGAEEVGADLSGECDHGDGIRIGGGDSGDQVGGSGSAGGETDSGGSGSPRVTVGHVGGALLVPYEDMPYVGLQELIVDGDDGGTGVAEYAADPSVLKHF